MGRRPHVLGIAFPAQGHVGPLMKFSHRLANHGIKVTFVNTEFIHARVLAALPEKSEEQNQIEMVSIPDGLEPGEDRKDAKKLHETMLRVMPGHLEELIRKINLSDDDEKITCVIADATLGWALETAKKMGIKPAVFWPAGVGSIALGLHIPKLIESGIIDHYGIPMKNELIQPPSMPTMSTTDFMWTCPGNPIRQKIWFEYVIEASQTVKTSNCLLCNSFYELDPCTCDLIPNLLPVGPLLSSNRLGQPAGNFWPEDSTCLSWLNNQPAKSVIYVAFGSLAIFNQHQFEELALGLEFLGKPFLWVVRSDLTNGSNITKYPDGFTERVSAHGKMVEWAPQEKVLAHPSIACFLTHCGWNSTMEGLSMGVPFLCWPYFGDQFLNKIYICDVWKVGLGLNSEENGVISRHEIKRKVEKLLSDDGIRANAFKLKGMTRKSVSEGGSSLKSFESFVEQLKC